MTGMASLHNWHEINRGLSPIYVNNLLYCFSEKVSNARCFMNSADDPKMIFTQKEKQRSVIEQNLMDLLINKARQ